VGYREALAHRTLKGKKELIQESGVGVLCVDIFTLRPEEVPLSGGERKKGFVSIQEKKGRGGGGPGEIHLGSTDEKKGKTCRRGGGRKIFFFPNAKTRKRGSRTFSRGDKYNSNGLIGGRGGKRLKKRGVLGGGEKVGKDALINRKKKEGKLRGYLETKKFFIIAPFCPEKGRTSLRKCLAEEKEKKKKRGALQEGLRKGGKVWEGFWGRRGAGGIPCQKHRRKLSRRRKGHSYWGGKESVAEPKKKKKKKAGEKGFWGGGIEGYPWQKKRAFPGGGGGDFAGILPSIGKKKTTSKGGKNQFRGKKGAKRRGDSLQKELAAQKGEREKKSWAEPRRKFGGGGEGGEKREILSEQGEGIIFAR